jgi:effector-binding domain-containing protein
MATTVVNRPTITESPGRHVLFQHHVVPQDQLGKTIPQSFGALYQRIESAGVVPAGPPFVIYNSMGSPWDLDVCAPVAAAMSPSPDFGYREMAASRVVSLLHVGPYDTLAATYEQIQDFIRDQGLEMAGPPREFYLSEPETPPERTQTIVEWPIR